MIAGYRHIKRESKAMEWLLAITICLAETKACETIEDPFTYESAFSCMDVGNAVTRFMNKDRKVLLIVCCPTKKTKGVVCVQELFSGKHGNEKRLGRNS